METETMIAKGNCERIGVDGKIGGRFDIIRHDPAKGFSLGSYAHIDIKLTKGKHVFTLVFERGAINLTHIDFKLKK